MQTQKFVRDAVLCAALLCWSLFPVQAGNIFKADVPDNLNLASSWSNSIAPATTDIATWDHTVQVNTNSLLGANLSWAGIAILDPATGITILTNTGATNITLGASGIDMSAAATGLVLSNNVTLGAAQTWTVDTN